MPEPSLEPPLLSVRDLAISFAGGLSGPRVQAVDGVSRIQGSTQFARVDDSALFQVYVFHTESARGADDFSPVVLLATAGGDSTGTVWFWAAATWAKASATNTAKPELYRLLEDFS